MNRVRLFGTAQQIDQMKNFRKRSDPERVRSEQFQAAKGYKGEVHSMPRGAHAHRITNKGRACIPNFSCLIQIVGRAAVSLLQSLNRHATKCLLRSPIRDQRRYTRGPFRRTASPTMGRQPQHFPIRMPSSCCPAGCCLIRWSAKERCSTNAFIPNNGGWQRCFEG